MPVARDETAIRPTWRLRLETPAAELTSPTLTVDGAAALYATKG